MALTANNYDLLQLSDIADRMVKQRLQSVDGVGRAQVFGEKRYAMRIWLSPSAMASRGITVQDIQTAILTRNVEIPAGRIESEQREFYSCDVTQAHELCALGRDHDVGELLGRFQFAHRAHGEFALLRLDPTRRDFHVPREDRRLRFVRARFAAPL